MLLYILHLDDLLTFPAVGEHWAFLPVVDVYWFLVECWIRFVTKSALCIVFLLLFLLLVFLLLLCCFLRLLGVPLFGSLLADVCLNYLLLLNWLFLLLCRLTLALIDLFEPRHQSIQRRLSKFTIVFWYLITTKHFVELTHAVIRRHSYIICSMADSFDCILCSLNLLVKAEVQLHEHSQ